MKNRAWFFSTFLILSLSASFLAGGCASGGPGRGAYPTLKQTQMMVDLRMTRYRNAVAAGAVTLGEQEQVNAAYQNWQKAFDAAAQAAHSDYEVTTPDNVKALTNQVIEDIDAIPL